MLPQNDEKESLFYSFMNKRSKNAINIKRLTTKTDRSKGTIYNWINPKSPYYIPDFPRPIRIGKRSVAWIEEEVDEYLAKLAKSRDQDETQYGY